MKIEEISDIFDFFDQEDILNWIGRDELMDFLLENNRPSEILDYFDDSDITSYLKDSQ